MTMLPFAVTAGIAGTVILAASLASVAGGDASGVYGALFGLCLLFTAAWSAIRSGM